MSRVIIFLSNFVSLLDQICPNCLFEMLSTNIILKVMFRQIMLRVSSFWKKKMSAVVLICGFMLEFHMGLLRSEVTWLKTCWTVWRETWLPSLHSKMTWPRHLTVTLMISVVSYFIPSHLTRQLHNNLKVLICHYSCFIFKNGQYWSSTEGCLKQQLTATGCVLRTWHRF